LNRFFRSILRQTESLALVTFFIFVKLSLSFRVRLPYEPDDDDDGVGAAEGDGPSRSDILDSSSPFFDITSRSVSKLYGGGKGARASSASRGIGTGLPAPPLRPPPADEEGVPDRTTRQLCRLG